MKATARSLWMVILISACLPLFCQQKGDSVVVKNGVIVPDSSLAKAPPLTPIDSAQKKVFVPRTAAIRSAILPGLGQIYNRKYWKLPLVYGALGTTAWIFRYNIKGYNRFRTTYNILYNKDTARYKDIPADLKPLGLGDLRLLRNEFRKNADYSVLVFLLFWALNVVDATVDAHLKGFDVSSDLSMKIKPAFNNGLNRPGLSLVFDLHKGKPSLPALP